MPGRVDVELQFGESVSEEVGEFGLVVEERGLGEAVEDVPAHEPGGVVRLGPDHVAANEVEGSSRRQPGVAEGLVQRRRHPGEVGIT